MGGCIMRIEINQYILSWLRSSKVVHHATETRQQTQTPKTDKEYREEANKLFAKFYKTDNTIQETNKKRLQTLKEAIKNGKYHVNEEQVAQNIFVHMIMSAK